MKKSIYQDALRSMEALVEGETDLISVMATISCELYQRFDHFNWVGFYRRVDDRTLKIGPYQGTHGCVTIDFDRGICGKCARESEIQLENDVCSVPSHIACSSDTKAEIVLPIFDSQSEVRAVLDVDSTELNVFDEVDVTHLTRVCRLVSERYG
jgi:L-methionine (R)-S-oxide reductase